LLSQDKDLCSFSERGMLKQLANWLGMLTLGRNKPILICDMDLCGMLQDACRSGTLQLLHVVPFVTRVLITCADSKVVIGSQTVQIK
jgi:CCR4-NOT transcription complex subunit 1